MTEVRGLSGWMKVIGKQELPSLNTVVKAICDLSNSDDSSADDLTQIILRDADLTSQVLKVANSVHYNRSYSPIKTVSRAIVQIGYVDLKNIALASTLIDGFLGGKPKELLVQRLAVAFHAAVQARAIAKRLSGDDHEEVFIAALLRRVAELALLATGRTAAEQFIMARDQNPEDEHTLALEILGVGINTLNKALIKEWGLGDLVMQASENAHSTNSRVTAVNLGVSISLNITKGMNHTTMRKLCQEVGQLTDQPADQVRENILLMAEEASAVAATYGAERLLPALPDRNSIERADGLPEEKTDFDFQRYMNRMSQMMMEGFGTSEIMQLAVQALYRGSDIPRVAINLMSLKDKRLEPAYVAGDKSRDWRTAVKIDLSRLRKDESLHDFLRHQEITHYRPQGEEPPTGILGNVARGGDCMLAPIRAKDRLVGIFYADANGGALTPRQFEEFQLTANQLNMYLRFYTQNGSKS